MEPKTRSLLIIGVVLILAAIIYFQIRSMQ